MNNKPLKILVTLLFSGLTLCPLCSVSFANDEMELSTDKTPSLEDYEFQLVCDPVLDEGKPQSCKIMLTDPNILDKSKATLILPNTDILLDVGPNRPESDALFSDKALDEKANSQKFERQKYRISRDWLFRLKITEEDKEPDISILSIIVPNEKTN